VRQRVLMGWVVTRVVLVVLLWLVAGGCLTGRDRPSGAAPTTLASPPPAPTRSPAAQQSRGLEVAGATVWVGSAIQPACERTAVETALRFATSFAVDPSRTASLIGPDFGWYSLTSNVGQHFVARDRNTLERYLRQRQRAHERLRLLGLRMTPRTQDTVNIVFLLVRTADDLPAGLGGPKRVAEGKGGINCRDGTVLVWSMAMNRGQAANYRDLSGRLGASEAWLQAKLAAVPPSNSP
jgi:hypothetical protein